MAIAIMEVDVTVAARAMRASRLIGMAVDNERGEVIGTIDDLMLTGDVVEFAILSIGGFLGLGAHLVAVPFDSLNLSEDRIVLPGATREELKRLPQFEYR